MGHCRGPGAPMEAWCQWKLAAFGTSPLLFAVPEVKLDVLFTFSGLCLHHVQPLWHHAGQSAHSDHGKFQYGKSCFCPVNRASTGQDQLPSSHRCTRLTANYPVPTLVQLAAAWCLIHSSFSVQPLLGSCTLVPTRLLCSNIVCLLGSVRPPLCRLFFSSKFEHAPCNHAMSCVIHISKSGLGQTRHVGGPTCNSLAGEIGGAVERVRESPGRVATCL